MSNIKAIQTKYNGFLFRSRLEARWAVFMDKLRVAYCYEPEGFDLDGLRYLPDFWLPDLRYWIEVKGRGRDTRTDWDKCSRLCAATGHPVWMLRDDFQPLACAAPDYEVVGSHMGWVPKGYYGWCDQDGHFEDGCCAWGQCPKCQRLGIGLHEQHQHCECECVEPKVLYGRQSANLPIWSYCALCGSNLSKEEDRRKHQTCHRGDSPSLVAAYAAARSARFEHGERPG